MPKTAAPLTDATALNLIDRIDEKTGASVGMWRNINVAPLSWGAVLAKKTKAAAPLSITKATSQARRHVDKLMPGVMATVESKLSHDLDSDTRLVVTTVTFPDGHLDRVALGTALRALSGVISARVERARIVVTRVA